MGMEYARLYFDFIDGEKGEFLREQCGDHGIVCLLRLWTRAGLRYSDGIFEKSPRAIEKIAKWTGESGKFIAALLDIDFPLLDKFDKKSFKLHNWEKNNPHLGEKAKQMRTERARKAGLASAEKRQQEQDDQLRVNSESTNSQLNPTQGQLNPTNLTKRNVTKPNTTNKASSPKVELAGSVLENSLKLSGIKLRVEKESLRIINLRLKEGYLPEDFERVTRNAIALKEAKPNLTVKLHPLTLFNGQMDKRLTWNEDGRATQETEKNIGFRNGLPQLTMVGDNLLGREELFNEYKNANKEGREQLDGYIKQQRIEDKKGRV